MPHCLVEVLSVALETIVYLDLGAVGRLWVGCNELQQLVKECKFGGGQVLMECRRLLCQQRARLCGRVVDAAAGARSTVSDLVAYRGLVGESSELGCVKRLIMDVGNKLTELIRWCMQHCQWGVRGVGVDEQMGSDGLVQMLVWWPRTE